MKRALISGITGQDSSFPAEFLFGKGYEAHGIVRRASTFNTDRPDPIYADPHETGVRLFLHYGDVTDGAGLRSFSINGGTSRSTRMDVISGLG